VLARVELAKNETRSSIFFLKEDSLARRIKTIFIFTECSATEVSILGRSERVMKLLELTPHLESLVWALTVCALLLDSTGCLVVR
jgi:hypothetical protein